MSDIERLRALLGARHGPLPWEWLDSGGEPEGDELQGADGEMVANNFRDDIGGPDPMVDGKLAAAAVNALPALLDVAEAAREFLSFVRDVKKGGVEAERVLRAAIARLEVRRD
jgi:hypothetical protein